METARLGSEVEDCECCGHVSNRHAEGVGFSFTKDVDFFLSFFFQCVKFSREDSGCRSANSPLACGPCWPGRRWVRGTFLFVCVPGFRPGAKRGLTSGGALGTDSCYSLGHLVNYKNRSFSLLDQHFSGSFLTFCLGCCETVSLVNNSSRAVAISLHSYLHTYLNSSL